jgi:uncharacterized SAM-binding protein YcdF (DUF218 family)
VAHRLQPEEHGRAGFRLLQRSAIGRSVTAFCTVALLLLAGGFGWFLWSLPADEVKLERDADGIVVLTGGASRITDAIELLAAGHGKRLLISGLNRTTTSGEILRLNPEFASMLSCCVDFDRSLNTVGNAVETRNWAESRGFRSLIVVTSSYHMPRAMAEISNQLPDIALLPFPVIGDKLKAEPWWNHGATLRLMLSEYLKYVAARVRIQVDPAPPSKAATPVMPAALVQASHARD